MELVILGCYGPYPPAGGACSGYLLKDGNNYFLLDCGNGVLGKLQYKIGINSLDAIFLSHLHSDHLSDLFILRYALQIELELGKRNRPLKLFVPGEPAGELERLTYKDVYEIETISAEKANFFGSLKFSFRETRHPVLCYAMRIEKAGANTLVYSGDTGYFPEIVPFAEGADLFLCEANFLEDDLQSGAPQYHLSALQASQIAREAGVKRLLLTHLPPYREGAAYLNEAGTHFPQAELAEEGKHYLF